MRINADGGHAHAGSHDGNLDTLVVAGVAVDTADIVDQNGILKEILSNKFRTQGIAGHQNRLTEADFILYIDMGSNCKVRHSCISFSKNPCHCEEDKARRGNPQKFPECPGDCHASVSTGSQ